MGELIERVKINNLVNGNGIVDNFKNNSLYFYNKYRLSDDIVKNIPYGKMSTGGFYFIHYKDDSNWMKYSPIFAVEFKKFGNLIIVLGINFNFIPLEVRTAIFDKFITEKDFDEDRDLKIDYKGVYLELLKYGFEYSLVEYNVAQMVSVHRIDMELIPRFLYSQHPINKYDPKKLYQIWETKLSTKSERDREMSNAVIKDFFEVSDDINNNYNQLKSHIQRLQKSIDKYG